MIYAQNLELLDAEGIADDGTLRICTLGGLPGPRSYEIPLSSLDAGWYSVRTHGCTEPFKVP